MSTVYAKAGQLFRLGTVHTGGDSRVRVAVASFDQHGRRPGSSGGRVAYDIQPAALPVEFFEILGELGRTALKPQRVCGETRFDKFGYRGAVTTVYGRKPIAKRPAYRILGQQIDVGRELVILVSLCGGRLAEGRK